MNYVVIALGALLISGASATSSPSPATMAIFGDSGEASRLQAAVVASAQQRAPFDAVLLLGDNVYPRGLVSQLNIVFWKPFAAILSNKPKVWMVLGNHDVMIENGEPQLKAFKTSRYSVEHLANLDLFRLDSNAFDAAQLKWLHQALSESKATFKVLAFHHPPLSSGLHGNRPDILAMLQPDIQKYQVQLVLNGHDHNYERLLNQGTTYIVAGNSSSIRKVGRQAQTQYVASKGGYVLMSVYPDRLELEAIDTKNTVFDRVEIVAASKP